MSLPLALDKFNDLLDYLLYNSPESIRVTDNDYLLQHYRYVEDTPISPKFTIELVQPATIISGIAATGTAAMNSIFATPSFTSYNSPTNFIYLYDTYVSFDNSTKYNSYAYTRHCDRLTELALVQNAKLVNEAVERFGNMSGFNRHNKITNLTKDDE